MPGTHYAIGFAVPPDGQQVLLLEKNRPAFLAGHIEPGETPAQAVRREAQEEGNIDTDE